MYIMNFIDFDGPRTPGLEKIMGRMCDIRRATHFLERVLPVYMRATRC